MPLRPRPLETLTSRRFLLMLIVPTCLILAGSGGYMAVEGWGFGDALYMTVITVTTVGFYEVHPLSPAGRAFTMLLALGGIFIVFYAATSMIGAIVSGELGGDLEKRRMRRALEQLEDHVIVCGYGRMGHLVCAEFSRRGMRFVVVDPLPGALDGFALEHGIPLAGDATHDEVLKQAGISRARCLVTVASSDADNLYITMSARLLNERLHIVARAEDDAAEAKLVRAGASRVISPYTIGGQRMAQAVLQPAVLDFLELAQRSDFNELHIEELRIRPQAALDGSEVKDSRIRGELGVIIVAIKRAGGEMRFNPAPEDRLQAGDVLIALGHREQLARLARLGGS
jgi:voltage-gated potassium channel